MAKSTAKSAEAFRTISEAATELDVPQHVLRHWEEVFGQVRPMRRAGGRRYYRPLDLDLLRGIRVLLYDQRYTTKGVQKIFKDEGVKYVSELGRRAAAGEPIDVRPVLPHENGAATDAGSPNSAADGEDDVLELGADKVVAPGMPRAIRDQLKSIISRIDAVEEDLDDAILALEAALARIDAAGGDNLDVDADDAA